MKKNNKNLSEIIEYLEDIIEKRKNSNNKTYTTNLLKKGIDRISQKIGEEAIEVVIAAKKKKKKDVIYESADLLFHLFVLWTKLNIKSKEIAYELSKRKK